jgi:hypothetical protein
MTAENSQLGCEAEGRYYLTAVILMVWLRPPGWIAVEKNAVG